MASELQSLSVLFQNRLFRIPDYQRGYAWKHEQLVDFWEDLLNLHNDRYHYTGLLSLKAVRSLDSDFWKNDRWLIDIGYKPYHVVDGQQRLTTFSILLYELVDFVRNMPENAGKEEVEIFIGYESLKDIKAKYVLRKQPPANLVTTYLFGYETDNPTSDYLKHRVFCEPFGGTVYESYYTKNLKYAKTFFSENLKAMYESEGLTGIDALYKKLTLRLMFNLHEIEDDYDVFIAFETMNNRGKKLTNLELLKNRLIYLTTLFDDDQLGAGDKDQLRKNINETWKEVYHQLGRNQNAPLSDDDFLRAHWITYFQYTRKSGNDYIKFLLNKFSAKNVFEKFTTIMESDPFEITDGFDSSDDDDAADDVVEVETVQISKLSPMEISDYINSLKISARYWYHTFFPKDDPELSNGEREWIEKLNRIGIGYFRPLVTAILATAEKSTVEERIELLRTIERFVFLSFRVGGFNSSYKSSDYYNKARDILRGNLDLQSITEDLSKTVKGDMPAIIANFITRTQRRFETGDGFYSWYDLRYFLYEYEHSLATRHNLQKVDWSLFSRVERDKTTIEHILPQTPTKWYWRNQFRQYADSEVKLLSSSLGNMLPLAHSINSSLQNDSFPDKKRILPTSTRGYANGSHSEIEVAAENEWTAQHILKRGLKLLGFMEYRWGLTLTGEQKMLLLHIDFVNDGRPEGPELPEEKATLPKPPNLPKLSTLPKPSDGSTRILTRGHHQRYAFWDSFVKYCDAIGRDRDVALRKANYDDWYDVNIGSRDYHVFFQIVRQKILRIGFYVYRPEDFARLESLRNDLETAYGSPLDWHTSREKSKAKRILHSIETDVHDPKLYTEHFKWLVSQFDKLKAALENVDTVAFKQ